MLRKAAFRRVKNVMDSSDNGPFERAFKRVSGAFAKGWKPGEFDTTNKAYFDALRHLPIDRVIEGAERAIRTRTRFPKVAEWLADVGPSTTPGTAPPGMRYMGESERDAHARAAALRWRDDPCPCLDCQAAGVADRPLRFVPTLEDGGEAKAFNARRNAVEVVGHWAHGEELRRWYAAHDACMAAAPPPIRRALRLVMVAENVVDAMVREREPGEDDQ
jgi:hypothetical protein